MNIAATVPSNTRGVPEFWPTVGHPGRVPLWALSPDPEQPRKHFDSEELNALAKTMQPGKGEQREIVTTRQLTQEEIASGRFGKAIYLIKSGERRWRAAAIAGLSDLEIRVKKYSSKADEKLDTWMLNGWRVGLSDIEDAYAIADIAKEYGWETHEEIADGIHRDQMWVSYRIALLKTTPRVQERLFPCENQFTLGTGVFFSRLAPEKQNQYLDEMPAECRTSASQINWMTNRLREEGVQLPTRTRDPRKIRGVIKNLISGIDHKLKGFELATDFDHVFEHASKAQKLELVAGVERTVRFLFELSNRLEALADGVGTASSPIIVSKSVIPISKPIVVERTAQKPVEKPILAARTEPSAPMPVKVERTMVSARQLPTHLVAPSSVDRPEMSPRVAPLTASSRLQTVTADWRRRGSLTVMRWYENTKEFKIDIVQLRAYVELWDQGWLEFQMTKTPKPSDLPDRAEVAEHLDLD